MLDSDRVMKKKTILGNKRLPGEEWKEGYYFACIGKCEIFREAWRKWGMSHMDIRGRNMPDTCASAKILRQGMLGLSMEKQGDQCNKSRVGGIENEMRGDREVWHRTLWRWRKALEIIIEWLAFTLIETGNHWRILSREVTSILSIASILKNHSDCYEE